MPPADIGKLDIALINLLCAQGLPGAEDMDIPAILKTLDRWAGLIKYDTDRHLYRFRRNPAEFNYSEADFRMLTLITVLQRDLGVKYSPARLGDYERPDCDFRNSKDCFIHGMVNSDNGGTCASLPILYIAVGRRLGYPLKLVLANQHLFVRWDDGKERLNIEGAGRGMMTYPDDYYRRWPFPLTDEEVSSGQFLRSLKAAEELSQFLKARACCLSDHNRIWEARDAYARAVEYSPESRDHRRDLWLADEMLAGRLVKTPNGLMPPAKPKVKPRRRNTSDLFRHLGE